jgi:hypothetical protein
MIPSEAWQKGSFLSAAAGRSSICPPRTAAAIQYDQYIYDHYFDHVKPCQKAFTFVRIVTVVILTIAPW